MVLLGHVLGFIVVIAFLWRQRRRRKRLVRAALGVINQYRGARPTQEQLKRLAHDFGQRMYTVHQERAVVMNELIDAIQDIN